MASVSDWNLGKRFLHERFEPVSFGMAVAGLMISSIVSAVEIPGWERPIMGAQLTRAEQSSDGSTNYLTLNQQDGSDKPTTFTLHEDTGIRCITTPCPSTREVEFKITAISPAFHGDSVRYEAVEVLKDIPPHVRIARRSLNVTESSMELVAPGGGGFIRRTMWEVVPFAAPSQLYYGNPEALASIALE